MPPRADRVRIHPACLGDDPAQDQDLAQVGDDSEELAKLMDGSGSSSESTTKGKGQLPLHVVHPSRGSEKHHSGSCQPCSFFLRGKCTVAEGCLYCHYEHDRPQRPGKKSRERAKRRIAIAQATEPSYAGLMNFDEVFSGFAWQAPTLHLAQCLAPSAINMVLDHGAQPKPADAERRATTRFSTGTRLARFARPTTWCNPAMRIQLPFSTGLGRQSYHACTISESACLAFKAMAALDHVTMRMLIVSRDKMILSALIQDFQLEGSFHCMPWFEESAPVSRLRLRSPSVLQSLFAVVEKTEKRRQRDDLYGDSWDVGPDGHWKPPPVSEGGPTARLAEVPRSYEAFYETADDAMRAQDELDGLALRGVSVRVTWPKEKFARKEPGMVNVQGVIGGVPDEEVKEFLTQAGKVRSLRRYKDIRFGEVLFKNEDDAWNAKVELEGTTLLGKILRLELLVCKIR
ncbi:unnamed protein product [Cladocopium goreaui]|uniref:RRM domain-containing protein n=1 Tax=Cladocopium goreaui TaxID=2562237 RepID=A0A9P1DTX2_9DINO|nr:unnamed protein product [Cladocopium goreaui]